MTIRQITTNLFKLAAAFILCVGFLMPVQEASAKGKSVSNSRAASLLTACLLADDGRSQRNKSRTKVRCCSKDLGFCITCNMDGSGLCKKSRHRAHFPPWLKDDAPKSQTNAPKRSSSSKKPRGSGIVAPNNRAK